MSRSWLVASLLLLTLSFVAASAARPADAKVGSHARPTSSRIDLPGREVDTGHDTGE